MKRRRKKPGDPPLEAEDFPASGALWTGLWCLCFFALAFVPDQKILRYKLLALEAGVAAILAVLLARWTIEPAPRWVRTPMDLPVALYAAAGVFFYLISPERGASSLELTRILFSAAAFFAASQTWTRLKSPRAVLWCWLATAGLIAAYALLQTTGGAWIIDVPLFERPIGTFGNPIFLAAFLAASLFAAGALGAEPGRTRAAVGVLTAVIFMALWETETRSAFAGLFAAAALAVLVRLGGAKRWGALAVLVGAAALGFWWFKDRQWTHGLIWRDTVSLWLSRFWFGCGLGRFHIEFADHASAELRALWPQRKVIVNFAHNEYLQVLAESGVVGFGALMAVVAGAVGTAAKALRGGVEFQGGKAAAWLSLAAAALLAQNLFSPDIRFGVSSFMVFFCLGAAGASVAHREVPLPVFPGRLGGAAIGAVLLILWGRAAVKPLLAERRLSRQPKFHVEKTDELRTALAALETRLKADPADADAAENLGFAYAKQKMWPQAISRFELAARLDPKRPGPLNNLGNIHYSLGNLPAAIAFWRRSIAVRGDQIDAHLNLGKALYEVGRLKESSEHLQTVLEQDPSNEKAQILLKKMIE